VEGWFWKGCKPNFVCPENSRGRESFVSAASTRDPSRRARPGAGRSGVPYLALHPMGFAVPPRLRLERWALTPPFHLYRALAPEERRRAVCFLWHFPSGRLTASPPACISKNPPAEAGGCKLRGIAPGGVRTFLLPRTASEEAILHPSRTGNSLPENGSARKPAVVEGPKSKVQSLAFIWPSGLGPWILDFGLRLQSITARSISRV
jgi:hypothetical protein